MNLKFVPNRNLSIKMFSLMSIILHNPNTISVQ